MSETTNKPKALFWVISAIALLWNLMGVGAFVFEMMSEPQALIEAYGQAEDDMVFARPGWATGVFAVAVFGGAIGCLLLLLRKKIAIWPLLISLIAVLLQQGYIWGMTDAAKLMSGADYIMPIMIPVIAIFLVWFARKNTAKGWLV